MDRRLSRGDGLTISTDPARLDLDRITGWLAESYWASDRDRATIERSLATRDAHGVYERVGFSGLSIPEIWMEIDRRATRPSRDDVSLPR
ncbi:MAG: hypothetical protein QOH14_2290 [Pseudonocardiales bacterium]|nr:hypothetical protein [Pseudonocardiales bacterium]